MPTKAFSFEEGGVSISIPKLWCLWQISSTTKWDFAVLIALDSGAVLSVKPSNAFSIKQMLSQRTSLCLSRSHIQLPEPWKNNCYGPSLFFQAQHVDWFQADPGDREKKHVRFQVNNSYLLSTDEHICVSLMLTRSSYMRNADLKEQVLFCQWQNDVVILLQSQNAIGCITVCPDSCPRLGWCPCQGWGWEKRHHSDH